MAAAIPYDEMEEKAPESKGEGEGDEPSADPADDDEFMMYAEEAGFTGEKAKSFWRAVARCVELTQQGGGSALSLGGEAEEAEGEA